MSKFKNDTSKTRTDQAQGIRYRTIKSDSHMLLPFPESFFLDASTVAEAISVISCWYEDKTEWGERVGWIYRSVTEDVLTGYRMHNRGWRSVYCVTKRDVFRGTAPINLTDRLHQVLRWATGSVEIFFSRNNALLASSKMKSLQRIAYLNVGIYPFTSIFLIVYCFLPALSLFSGQFIVQRVDVTFLAYLLTITITLCLLAVLEVKWSGVELEEWWRNEQFWLIGGTSAHLAAVLQGLLKVVAGIEISFTLTSKSGGDDENDDFADLYLVKWTSLVIPPITIMMTNLIAIAVGFSRTIYSAIPQWSRLLGGVFFSFWAGLLLICTSINTQHSSSTKPQISHQTVNSARKRNTSSTSKTKSFNLYTITKRPSSDKETSTTA